MSGLQYQYQFGRVSPIALFAISQFLLTQVIKLYMEIIMFTPSYFFLSVRLWFIIFSFKKINMYMMLVSVILYQKKAVKDFGVALEDKLV